MSHLNENFSEERNENDVDYRTVQYNPHKSLPLDHQRVRLPIYNLKDQIAYLLEQYQVLVVVGETGCGKSTQLPHFLHEFGYSELTNSSGVRQMIGVTEPRRIAAISLAARVSEEMGTELGNRVGYSIRFEEYYSREDTAIKFMTEGILIREMMNDPLLTAYSVIMVDEVHERSVNTDILLSLLKKILKKRPDLKLVISSATLDSNLICNYFNHSLDRKRRKELDRDSDKDKDIATVMFVEGRTYPVDTFYLEEATANYVDESVKTVIKIHENHPHGDVLVFLTGQEEVDECVSQLFEYARNLKDEVEGNSKSLFVLPLYASLPANDQLKVFQTFSRNTRKVIVATNIAEASITIDGIIYVVDCGFVKQRFFNPSTGTDSLIVRKVSKASAQQRAGRAGRNKHGYAFRLFPEAEFEKLEDFSPPEVERVALPSVILQLKALGINNIVGFDFLSPPPEANIISAFDILFALKAIDMDGLLTDPTGLRMAEFPLAPQYSKMLLASEEYGCGEEMLSIVSLLQVQNLFVEPRSGQRAQQARRAKHNLSVEEGDTITYLNIFKQFVKNDRIRSFADRHYLNYKALCRAYEIRQRLRGVMINRFGMKIQSSNSLENILKCLVSGMFTNAAILGQDDIYRTVRGGHELAIHPVSVLYTMKRPPRCVVFSEIVHTTKEYMKDVTAIEQKWLCEIAPHYYQFGTEREVYERRVYTQK